ncbi:serine protease inhibitor swm-1-like [Xenopus tropicalis]|uniref:Serine protease inhibitor swm-1-like n=1 Tax=Xenopus tropicalis TaxID=8364 RepID=F6VVN4_XENTR|nr:serine protease inhibitor swm-1-like [Xenopus tropicalis]
MGICKKYSSLSLLAMALIFVAPDQSEAATTKSPCPANMFYHCKRTCFNNCDNLNSMSDAGCTRVCRLGCDCKEGYVFKSKNSNTCVPVSACNVSCPEHSAFIPCYRYGRKSCSSSNMEHMPSQTCSPRCVCNKGYILTDDLFPRCIKTSTCPKNPVIN